MRKHLKYSLLVLSSVIFFSCAKIDTNSTTSKVSDTSISEPVRSSSSSKSSTTSISTSHLKKLETPSISINNGILTIVEVNNANMYQIYANDEYIDATYDNTFDLSSLEIGTYNIKVRAINSNNLYTPSDFSNVCVFDKYQKFENTLEPLSRVGQDFEYLGTVSYTKPIVSNEGLSNYPKYLTPLADTSNNEAIKNENLSLIASQDTYDSMDKDGNLYLNGVSISKKLYKHSSSVGLYMGDVDDNENRVSKRIIVNEPRLIGNYLTGLYAPAGEVIKIEISEEDLAKTGGLTVIMGEVAGRNNENVIPVTTVYNRMPYLANKMNVTQTTSYVGSYLGGPIYLYTNKPTSFKVTISGAVEYLHYIDGLTSEEEFNRLMKTSAPFLDFEIYDKSLRFTGPRYNTYTNGQDTFDYKNLKNTMRLWQNFNSVSRSVPHGMNSNAFITMMYDTFVGGGAAALAYVGADYAVLPVSWMPGTINYESFMKVGGWGSIHEFNHHFQKIGCNGNSNEVSNNVMNFIEYIMFTRITEYRNYNNISHGIGLDSNEGIKYYNQYRNYIDPQSGELIKLNTERGYAILIENFGPQLMLEVFKYQNGVTTVDAFYKALTEVLHYDFEFFFKELWHLDVDSNLVLEMKKYNYKTYVPIGSYYSSSFNYTDINNESNHALPYLCNSGLIIDFDKDIITLDDYNIDILEIGSPLYGNLIHLSNNIYKYITDKDIIDSFVVKVKISKGDFEQIINITYDLNPINQGLNLTTYEYNEIPYANIGEAIENNFTGYNSIKTTYQSNQNVTNAKVNTIVCEEGKFIINEDGNYQVCYKGGRGSSKLFVSINNQDNYELFGEIDINQSLYQLNAKANKLISLKKGDELYFKLYLLPTSNNASLEIGLALPNDLTNVIRYPDEYFRSNNSNFNKDLSNFELRNNVVELNDYDDKVDSNKLTLSSPNFVPWDNNQSFGLEKILDNDSSTYAHSQRNIIISETNFVDLIIDSTKLFSFTTMKIYGRTNGMPYQIPVSFDLYLKKDNDYVLYKSYNNVPITKNELVLAFDEIISTSSIKLHITKTDGQYLALSNMEFMTSYKSLKISDISYYGNVDISYEKSPYGFVYDLAESSYLKYEFDDSICIGINNLEGVEVYLNNKLYNPRLIDNKELFKLYEFNNLGKNILIIKTNNSNLKIFDLLKLI